MSEEERRNGRGEGEKDDNVITRVKE